MLGRHTPMEERHRGGDRQKEAQGENPLGRHRAHPKNKRESLFSSLWLPFPTATAPSTMILKSVLLLHFYTYRLELTQGSGQFYYCPCRRNCFDSAVVNKHCTCTHSRPCYHGGAQSITHPINFTMTLNILLC